MAEPIISGSMPALQLARDAGRPVEPGTFSRRKALVGALAGTAVSAAAMALPMAAAAAEHPWVKAKRLASELSGVLAHCDEGRTMALVEPVGFAAPAVLFADREHFHENTDGAGLVGLALAHHHAIKLAAAMDSEDLFPGDGGWFVTIRSGDADQPIFFGKDFAPRPSKARSDLADFAVARFDRLAKRHQRAEKAFNSAYEAWLDDSGEEIMNRASAAFERALMAICSYVPATRADERARADYLATWAKAGNDLERHHVAALLGTMGRYELTGQIRSV